MLLKNMVILLIYIFKNIIPTTINNEQLTNIFLAYLFFFKMYLNDIFDIFCVVWVCASQKEKLIISQFSLFNELAMNDNSQYI